MTFDELKNKMLKNSEIKKEYDNLEPEYEIIRALIEAREEMNMSQKELAEKVGTDQSHISRLEHGSYNPSLKFLKKIAAGLGKELHISFVNPSR